MHIRQRLLMAATTAVILMFFSEFFFVNESVVADGVDRLQGDPFGLLLWTIELMVWYGLPAYLFLTAVAWFRLRTVGPLFLAGALFGWTVEGIIVWQMYEALPFTISWTPLGWHALVDVLLGWYLVRRVLQKDRYLMTVGLAIALGIAWGMWATWSWAEVLPEAPAEFVSFAFFSSVLWILATAVLDRWGGRDFAVSRLEIGLLIALLVVVFALQIGPIFPQALLILLPLLLVVLWLLQRQRTHELSLLATFSHRPRVFNYLLLLLVPVVTAVTYTALYQSNIRLPLVDTIAPLLTLLGFVVFLLASVKILIGDRRPDCWPQGRYQNH